MRSSDDFKLRHHEFRDEIRKLSEFENNISHVNRKFEELDVIYTDDYAMKVSEIGVFPMTQSTINDIMQKSGSKYDASGSIFESIKYVPNHPDASLPPIGYPYLKEHIALSKRDNLDYSITDHRVLFYNNQVVGLKNHLFPYKTFQFSDFLPIFLDAAEDRGKPVEKPYLSFNEATGNIRGELLFDEVVVEPAAVNDIVNYGVKFSDGKLGGSSFRISVGIRVADCSNLMITHFENMESVVFAHTSEGNYASHFADFLQGVHGKTYMTNEALVPQEKAIISYLENKRTMEFHEDAVINRSWTDSFYNLLANSVMDAVEAHKHKEKMRLETAASTNIDDYMKVLERTFVSFGLPKRDLELAKEIFENDDLINTKNPSYYDLSNNLSRLANDPRFNEVKADKYRVAAYDVLTVPN